MRSRASKQSFSKASKWFDFQLIASQLILVIHAGKYGDLDSSLISYGPCQTPTLGFCVDRHDQIQTFKPETYWVIQVTVEKTINEHTKKFSLEWDRVRCFDKEVAVMFTSQVKNAREARVVSVTTKEKAKERPIALNTVELMRVASSGLGMGPHHAMQVY